MNASTMSSSSRSNSGASKLPASVAGGEPDAKRRKVSMADHLICCITLSLPLDPVTAMDGSVYERSAIEQYFATKGEGKVKSPSKGLMMGRELLPAPHIKNIIETAIETGSITGELAVKWKEKAEQEKAMEELLKRAEKGDARAMELVAKSFEFGLGGLKKDSKKAYSWYKKANAAGSVLGMAMEGHMLVKGLGVEKDVIKGMMYLGSAEGRGSDIAAYLLGVILACPLSVPGARLDKTKAKQLLKKALSGTCAHQHMNPKTKESAQKNLDKLESA